MQINKYKVTITGREGSALIVYQDKQFRSFILDIRPALLDGQLNWLLNKIPADENFMDEVLVNKKSSKFKVELIAPDTAVNKVVAWFCERYEVKTGLKYIVSSSDAGKITRLKASDQEWSRLFDNYFSSENFLFKNKYSISNLVKYWNELKVETFSQIGTSYPLPYDHSYCLKLNIGQKQEYWKFLRGCGYEWKEGTKRGEQGQWVKKSNVL